MKIIKKVIFGIDIIIQIVYNIIRNEIQIHKSVNARNNTNEINTVYRRF